MKQLLDEVYENKLNTPFLPSSNKISLSPEPEEAQNTGKQRSDTIEIAG